MKDYRGNATIAQDTGDLGELAGEKRFYRSAAQMYLSSGVTGAGEQDLVVEKKPKRFRTKSMEWGIAVHNALRVSSGQGLERFNIAPHIASGVVPYEWPSLSVAPDQGGDGFCFLNAMMNGAFKPMTLNVEVIQCTYSYVILDVAFAISQHKS